MSGRRSRNKGARWEREVARMFGEAMEGADIRRGIQNRTGGDASDVEGAGRMHIECKVGKLPNPRAALAQARRDAKGNKIPLAVIKDDRQIPFVVMGLSEFLEFVRRWWSYELECPLGSEPSGKAEREIDL